jgi:hypothetical protein
MSVTCCLEETGEAVDEVDGTGIENGGEIKDEEVSGADVAGAGMNDDPPLVDDPKLLLSTFRGRSISGGGGCMPSQGLLEHKRIDKGIRVCRAG